MYRKSHSKNSAERRVLLEAETHRRARTIQDGVEAAGEGGDIRVRMHILGGGLFHAGEEGEQRGQRCQRLRERGSTTDGDAARGGA